MINSDSDYPHLGKPPYVGWMIMADYKFICSSIHKHQL